MSHWAAILAGGSGTRFWPLSTPATPKQFLRLVGDRPLLVETVARLNDLIPSDHIFVITGTALVDETRRLLPQLPARSILGEPRAASTAPALAWATMLARKQDSNAVVLSLHADWYVGDGTAFRATAAQALNVAEQHDVLVTVGMVPTRPEVGYGYIVPGEELAADARSVAQFVEKPSVERAKELIAQGALWNCGLFAWTAERFVAETESVATELAPHLPRLVKGDVEGFFAGVTPIAVDVSHFERSDRVAVVPGRFPWDDVGTWSALARIRAADEGGNVTVGEAVAHNARGCVIWAEDARIVVDGVQDLVVVQANGVTLVTTTDRAAQLKALLESLPASIREFHS